MDTSRRIALASLVLSPAAAVLGVPGPSAAAAPDKPIVLHDGDVPIGLLGHRVGSYLTIAGNPARTDRMKAGTGGLIVDTVNGRKLESPTEVTIENLDPPAGKRCVIKGYETLGMIGTPPAWVESEEEQGRNPAVTQAGWQVRLSFVALLVVEPEGLRIRKRR